MRRPIRLTAAFNLMELLVAIAVIAVLAAVLLPALSAARQRAKRATCLANLRQITAGIRVYCDDANDSSPATATNHVWAYYKTLLQGYVSHGAAPLTNNPLFACPADTFHYSFGDNTQVWFNSQGEHEMASANFSSYLFNGANEFTNGEAAHPLPGIAGRKLSSIKHPARTVLVAEWPAIAPYSWHEPKRPLGDTRNCVFNNARDMVGFVDGHVSYIRFYWRQPGTISLQYDPPADYDYQWSGD